MPMSFPDMASLGRAAKIWNFRKPDDGEAEEDYRNALADYVVMRDSIESMEIRSGKGWDGWNQDEQSEALRRTIFAAPVGSLKVVDENDAQY